MSLSTSEHHNGDDDVEEIVVLLCKDQLQAVQRWIAKLTFKSLLQTQATW